MTPQSTTRAIDLNRPRWTAWCSNTQRLASPRPNTLATPTASAASFGDFVVPATAARKFVLALGRAGRFQMIERAKPPQGNALAAGQKYRAKPTSCGPFTGGV